MSNYKAILLSSLEVIKSGTNLMFIFISRSLANDRPTNYFLTSESHARLINNQNHRRRRRRRCCYVK